MAQSVLRNLPGGGAVARTRGPVDFSSSGELPERLELYQPFGDAVPTGEGFGSLCAHPDALVPISNRRPERRVCNPLLHRPLRPLASGHARCEKSLRFAATGSVPNRQLFNGVKYLGAPTWDPYATWTAWHTISAMRRACYDAVRVS